MKNVRIVAVGVVFFALSATGWATPSPVNPVSINSLLYEWDFCRDPAIKGGAKTIEQVTSVDNGSGGMTAKDKTTIKFNDKGQRIRSDSFAEEYGRPIHSSDVYRYNTDGDLVDHVLLLSDGGAPERLLVRHTAIYAAKGKLLSVKFERSRGISPGGKNNMAEHNTVVAETVTDGTRLTVKYPRAKTEVVIMFVHEASGPATSMTCREADREVNRLIFERDAAGNLLGWSTKNRQDSIVGQIKYEFDAKANWTKAVVVEGRTSPDGQEVKRTKEILRKITY